MMGIEIERKFVVKQELWVPQQAGRQICQGYLCLTPERIVRIRTKGQKAFLTVKGRNEGISRPEFEYEIPFSDAAGLFALCIPPLLEKVRYIEEAVGHVWEIDRFLGENSGLLVAEVELQSKDEKLVLPEWVGQEVSGDARYYNSNLIRHPYRTWQQV